MIEVQRIPLDKIKLSPLNVRQEIDVGSLTCSIERTGQIEPLRLRPVGGGYEIRTGRRRFLALKQAGATHADAIVVEGTDEAVVNEQWDENEERADYTDYERALKLQQLLDTGPNQTELAKRIGQDQSWVSRHLSILRLDGIMPRGIIAKITEGQVRPILAAPEEDWRALVQYVEVYFEEQGRAPPASNLEDYALQLMSAREFDKNRRRFLYEIEGEPAPTEEPRETTPEDAASFVEEHNLGWVFDAEANGNRAGFLTKIATLTNEELEFCLANEARALNLQRLNEERDRRRELFSSAAKRSPLKQPPVTSAQVVATINQIVGTPAEDLQGKLSELHGLSEEEAQAALQAFRETYPDIWDRCYSEKLEEEEEEELTVEQYVADVLHHNPEVKGADLVKAVVELYDVSEAYAQSIIDREGPKHRDLYATRSPTLAFCPLCGRANADKNKILMVLEAYEAQPGVSVVDWLKEVLA